MSLQNNDIFSNFTRGGNIDAAQIINTKLDLPINYIIFILCLILILIGYLGPFLYFKVVRKKNFNPQRNGGVSHVI